MKKRTTPKPIVIDLNNADFINIAALEADLMAEVDRINRERVAA